MKAEIVIENEEGLIIVQYSELTQRIHIPFMVNTETDTAQITCSLEFLNNIVNLINKNNEIGNILDK